MPDLNEHNTLKALQDAYDLLIKAWNENQQLRSLLGLNPSDAIPSAPISGAASSTH